MCFGPVADRMHALPQFSGHHARTSWTAPLSVQAIANSCSKHKAERARHEPSAPASRLSTQHTAKTVFAAISCSKYHVFIPITSRPLLPCLFAVRQGDLAGRTRQIESPDIFGSSFGTSSSCVRLSTPVMTRRDAKMCRRACGGTFSIILAAASADNAHLSSEHFAEVLKTQPEKNLTTHLTQVGKRRKSEGSSRWCGRGDLNPHGLATART